MEGRKEGRKEGKSRKAGKEKSRENRLKTPPQLSKPAGIPKTKEAEEKDKTKKAEIVKEAEK